MKRSTKLLVSILFPLALVAAPLSILLPVEPVEIENRALEAPNFTIGSLAQPSYYLDLFRYVVTANPLRGLLIRMGSGLDYWVFEDSPDPTRVLKGTDDWLYLRATVETPCRASSADVFRNLREFVETLEETVPTVVFTVAPSKFVIHPEHLTAEQTALSACARQAGEQLRELLEASAPENYVDSWRLLETLEQNGMMPYFRTDTHFHYAASIPWMQALVEEIAPIWDEGAVRDLGPTLFLGNLMTFIGLEEPEKVDHVVVERGLDHEVEELGPRLREYRFTGNADLVSGRTLILGDSFMEIPEPSIVQYFADVTYADWRSDDAVAYFLEHSPRAERVIVEVSELNIWERFGGPDLARRLGGK